MANDSNNFDLDAADRTQIQYMPVGVQPPLAQPHGQTHVRTQVEPTERAPADHTNTAWLSRREIVQGVRVKHTAHLEISGLPEGFVCEFQLDAEGIDIGRISRCSLCLPLPNVSRQHARILLLNEDYTLEDLNSTNGTFVNGVRVSKCVLRNNDLIEIGEAKILFVEQKVRQ